MALIENAADGFTTYLGPVETPADEGFMSIETKYSRAHIEGFHSELFEDIIGLWDFNARIGEDGELDEIKERLEVYRTKLKNCLPSTIEEVEMHGDDLLYSIKKFEYEGNYKDESQSLILRIPEFKSDDGLYSLEIEINEPF